MKRDPLPFNAALSDYVAQADALFTAWHAGDEQAIDLFWSRHPKFLDDKIPWLRRRMSIEEVRATPITREDASLALARWYDFADWPRLVECVERSDSLVRWRASKRRSKP